MAGHSKYKNIMYRKGAQDKKRSAQFSKLSREITVAAKMGMPDPAMNPRLRLAVKAAKALSMPKDVIDRAIKKSMGGDAEDYTEIRYEGYGPGGTALIVDAMTDNRNRTASEVRAAFNKFGGSLGETGSVSFMFDRVGQIIYPADVTDSDTMFEAVFEAGAENVETDETGHEVVCAPDDFNAVREALETIFGAPEESGLTWKPQNLIAVDEGQASTLLKLLDALDDDRLELLRIACHGLLSGHHFLPLTWASSSVNDGRSPEYRTLRPNSIATCGA